MYIYIYSYIHTYRHINQYIHILYIAGPMQLWAAAREQVLASTFTREPRSSPLVQPRAV